MERTVEAVGYLVGDCFRVADYDVYLADALVVPVLQAAYSTSLGEAPRDVLRRRVQVHLYFLLSLFWEVIRERSATRNTKRDNGPDVF